MPTPEIEAKAEQMANRALVRLAFFFPSEDATVVRDFNMPQIEAGEVPEAFDPSRAIDIPSWVREPLKQWEHPQDPVTFSGYVDPDQEVEAWAAIAPPDQKNKDRVDAVGPVSTPEAVDRLADGSGFDPKAITDALAAFAEKQGEPADLPVQVVVSELCPADKLFIADPTKIPGLLGVDPEQVRDVLDNPHRTIVAPNEKTAAKIRDAVEAAESVALITNINEGNPDGD